MMNQTRTMDREPDPNTQVFILNPLFRNPSVASRLFPQAAPTRPKLATRPPPPALPAESPSATASTASVTNDSARTSAAQTLPSHEVVVAITLQRLQTLCISLDQLRRTIRTADLRELTDQLASTVEDHLLRLTTRTVTTLEAEEFLASAVSAYLQLSRADDTLSP